MVRLKRDIMEHRELRSRRHAERNRRIKEAQERREAGYTGTKPNLRPVVKKTQKEEMEECREEREALVSVRRDLKRIRKDKHIKMSIESLDYLLKNNLIPPAQHVFYKTVEEDPEKRTCISAKGVIENVNDRLLFYCKNIQSDTV